MYKTSALPTELHVRITYAIIFCLQLQIYHLYRCYKNEYIIKFNIFEKYIILSYLCRKRTPNNIFISERIIENINACKKLLTKNPGTIYAANKISNAFITSENNPRVIIVKGSVISKMIGRINKFIAARITAKTKAAIIVVCTPGTIYAAV